MPGHTFFFLLLLSALLTRQGRPAQAGKVLADSVYHLQDSALPTQSTILRTVPCRLSLPSSGQCAAHATHTH